MPACDNVKQMKTPTAYSGMSAFVCPLNIQTITPAIRPRATMPFENASLSPRAASCLGMYPSFASGWQWKAALNGLGAVATGVVSILQVVTKFIEGAWIVVLIIPLIIVLLERYRINLDDAVDLGRLRTEEGEVAAVADEDHHHRYEHIGRHAEGHPRLSDSAKIDDGQQSDRKKAEPHSVRNQRVVRRRNCRDSTRDRHCNRHDVVG